MSCSAAPGGSDLAPEIPLLLAPSCLDHGSRAASCRPRLELPEIRWLQVPTAESYRLELRSSSRRRFETVVLAAEEVSCTAIPGFPRPVCHLPWPKDSWPALPGPSYRLDLFAISDGNYSPSPTARFELLLTPRRDLVRQALRRTQDPEVRAAVLAAAGLDQEAGEVLQTALKIPFPYRYLGLAQAFERNGLAGLSLQIYRRLEESSGIRSQASLRTQVEAGIERLGG